MLRRLVASNQDYQRAHGHYIVPLAQRLLDARSDLDDEKVMSAQAVGDLRLLEKDWPRMCEETNFDGEPLIVELLRSVIDDLGGNQ